ncbi:MAG TPA: zinc ribbon domain-containing protein [Terriglobales bacterium]|nr:zinc ribbon domain-containing protein [Terriglobales bacterium]
MFCDACGAQVQGNQRFCGTCGKPLGAVVAGRVSTRVADHRQMLGILWIIYGILHAIGGAILFIMAHTFFVRLAQMPQRDMPPGALGFLTPLLSFISVLILAKGLLALAGGVGLLQKQHWARTIALVSGFVSLIDIPLGTGLGIYTIWVMMSANAEYDYEKLAAPQA